MILIYSPISSARLKYTVKQVFGLIPGLNYEITDNKDVFLAANDARINYSNEIFDGVLNITPHNLLFETGISTVSPQAGKWESVTTLFPTYNKEIPFDIFSATFFLLSRYEEYTDKHRDKHGRFTAHQSFANKNGFLQQPIINIWVNKLRVTLNKYYNLNISKLEYQCFSTIDIDHVFYYKHKPVIRNLLGGIKQLLQGKTKDFATRVGVFLGKRKDPNDVYEWLEQEHAKHNTKATYFFLLGDAAPPYDPEPIFDKTEVRKIIQNTAAQNPVGIHPSYHSNGNTATIKEEISRLENITGKPVNKSRQHFLRFNLPETYTSLIENGITEEYSMGYADEIGFRAGIAAPFTWFNLETNKETELTVYPFAVMDVSLKNYMKLAPKEAMEVIKGINANVQEHGGSFMSLWHNESVSESGEWKNWRKVYQLLLTFSPGNGN